MGLESARCGVFPFHEFRERRTGGGALRLRPPLMGHGGGQPVDMDLCRTTTTGSRCGSGGSWRPADRAGPNWSRCRPRGCCQHGRPAPHRPLSRTLGGHATERRACARSHLGAPRFRALASRHSPYGGWPQLPRRSRCPNCRVYSIRRHAPAPISFGDPQRFWPRQHAAGPEPATSSVG